MVGWGTTPESIEGKAMWVSLSPLEHRLPDLPAVPLSNNISAPHSLTHRGAREHQSGDRVINEY